ncbi:MAG: phospholipase A [Deltaproteobacteria bacterium]
MATWSAQISAQEPAYPEEVATPQQSAAEAVKPDSEPTGRQQTWLPQIEPRRGGTNFFVLSAWSSRRDNQPNERGLVEFQLDLSYDITRLENWPDAGIFFLTFPFRLTSFWDLFSKLPGSKSAPFLETGYAPGLEVSWIAPQSLAHFFALRAGVMHESNGLGVVANGPDQLSNSRSWNFAYAGASVELPVPRLLQTRLDLAGWLPFGDDPVAAWPNGKDAGTRLQDHFGYFEFGADIRLVYPTLRVRVRQSALAAQLRLPFKKAQVWDGLSQHGNGFRLDFILHCHVGKGERLTTANQPQYACYAGVGL